MHTLKIGVLDVSGVEGGEAFTVIRSAAGLSTNLTPVGAAMPLAAAAG